MSILGRIAMSMFQAVRGGLLIVSTEESTAERNLTLFG